MDRFAPMRAAIRPGKRRRPLPDAEIDGGEVSFDHLIGAHNGNRISRLNRQVCDRLHYSDTLFRHCAHASPHFSHYQLFGANKICFDGCSALAARDRGADGAGVIWFCGSPWAVGDAALLARRGGACQTGAARALAAAARRRAAQPQSAAAGQADAMAILMRRTEIRTSAPIFNSLSLMVPQVASAKAVSARAMRRSAQTST